MSRDRAFFPHQSLKVLPAAYGFGLAKNRPFVDGNKRAAFAAVIVFMAKNRVRIDPSPADATHTIPELAAASLSKEQLNVWISENIAKA